MQRLRRYRLASRTHLFYSRFSLRPRGQNDGVAGLFQVRIDVRKIFCSFRTSFPFGGINSRFYDGKRLTTIRLGCLRRRSVLAPEPESDFTRLGTRIFRSFDRFFLKFPTRTVIGSHVRNFALC